MNNFERSQRFVAVAEGGANFDVINGVAILKPKNRNDTGGPTNFGITWGALARAYSQGIVDHNDIIRLTKAEANKIYEANYWRPSRADRMEWGLCLVHYDCAVNCGVGGAGRQLQRALNDLGKRVNIDGVVGPLSLQAISELPLDALIAQYITVREAFYHGIVARNASQGVFLRGWLNRMTRLRAEVGA